MKLTARQREILDFIERQVREHGLPPTRAEIVHHFGFASPNAAQCHLQALARQGAIELRPNQARGIIARSSKPSARGSLDSLPLIGRVTAGTPVLAVENHEDEIRLDRSRFRPSPDFALRVEGDSMIEAGILDRDLLLVHSTPEARSGQVVVARLGEEVTVKRLRRRGRATWLEPANQRYEAIAVTAADDFAIEGLGVGVIRNRLG
ncbi:MAG: transcriptional repressor LexA [Wenzhouxiangella sp.]|nr:MAG: transcriptional repressor LexA [Wenzhouxiangella sp.]